MMMFSDPNTYLLLKLQERQAEEERAEAKEHQMADGAQVATDTLDAAQQHTGFMAFCFGPAHRQQGQGQIPALSASTAEGLVSAIKAAGWVRVGTRTLCASCASNGALG